MVQFYVMMVKTNKIVIDDVPLLWKDSVAAAIGKVEVVEN